MAFLFSGFASAQQGEMSSEDFHEGIPAEVTMRHENPFLSLLQVSATPDFAVKVNLGIASSMLAEDGSHERSATIRVPWDFPLPSLSFRSFYLDATTGELGISDPITVPVGLGERIYFESQPGLFVLEMEFEQPVDSWVESQAHFGFSGPGTLVWTGSNHFYQECQNGTIEIPFMVESTGQYALAIRSYHEGGDQNNDIWARFDDGECSKVYSSASNNYVWNTAVSPGNGGFKATLDPGRHVLSISARSKDFFIDRIHLFDLGVHSRTAIEDETLSLSPFDYEVED